MKPGGTPPTAICETSGANTTWLLFAAFRLSSYRRIEPGTRVHAFTGIADPESFERALSDLGLTVTGSTRYRDHHPFSVLEIEEAAARAAEEGADHLAVTAKDRVRWPRGGGQELPVPAVFDVDVRLESEDLLLEIVTRLLQGAPR